MCVLDTSVIRQVTNKIRTDKEIFRKFQLIVSFDKRDVVNVFEKYVKRVETMMGIEVTKQYEEKLKKSKQGVLEQLRVVKRKVSKDINLVTKKTR